MMLKIENVLSAAEVDQCRAIIDEGPWVDGNETSGHQSALAKKNEQIAQGSDAANKASALVMAALGRTPEFVAAALPLKVYMPMFNRYAGGQTFGNHVDNAIRQVRGTDVRIRSDLSCTLFLTDPDTYEGGELIVQDLFGEHQVKLAAGDMVLYPASSLHRVMPVTKGSRVSCIFWLQSMVRENAAREHLFRLDTSIQQLTVEKGGEHPIVVDLTNLYHNLLRRWADS
ncbi:Fe2+-dependent dioxygenase [Parasphingorhabdus sp.]|uniref:Fe2+-dependent dioxygenase n=1 Tax=Parasphingorhabdus sp. TaxID=2709688 RepID=UPI003A8FE9D4